MNFVVYHRKFSCRRMGEKLDLMSFAVEKENFAEIHRIKSNR